MPSTPYHFGPSGFIGLLFRRWLDVPVFIAANAIINIEVIADHYLSPGWPVHQIWHFHTLLIGGLAGLIFGLAVYFIVPFRWLSEKSMAVIGLPQRATWLSTGMGGLLGGGGHVLLDSFYHFDVQIFWPKQDNMIFRWINQGKMSNAAATQRQVIFWCLVGGILMIGICILLLVLKAMEKRPISDRCDKKTIALAMITLDKILS